MVVGNNFIAACTSDNHIIRWKAHHTGNTIDNAEGTIALHCFIEYHDWILDTWIHLRWLILMHMPYHITILTIADRLRVQDGRR